MLAKPTKQQLEWHDMEVGLFIHFNIKTYAPDWNYRSFKDYPDPNLFNPVSLDTDQWIHAAEAIGAKYASPRAHTDGIGEVWLPGECDTTIRGHHWFWKEGTEHALKSVEHLTSIYYNSVGRGCNLILNSNPNKDGLIPESDMARYDEFSAEIKRRFSKCLAQGGLCDTDSR